MRKTLIGLAILALAATTATAQAECYSEGTRVGSLQKFSQKGLISKSWEGEIVMEGTKMRGTSDGSFRGGNVWRFSVLDPNVAKVIDEAAMTGGTVALKYCQASPLNPFTKVSSDTPYRITEATVRK